MTATERLIWTDDEGTTWGEPVSPVAQSATVPVEQVRALVRLLYPDHMTAAAKRQIESVCEAAEARDV